MYLGELGISFFYAVSDSASMMQPVDYRRGALVTALKSAFLAKHLCLVIDDVWDTELLFVLL
jgi:hypothetical protein